MSDKCTVATEQNALVRGQVVLSTAGRDKNRLLVVVQSATDHVLVADGKERKLAVPKRKNPKHLTATGVTLPEELLRFNNPLRKALNRLASKIRATE
ncbi:MAG: KOW domain-containing RNA-binding protein [Oscillospiraceae bacterium]|jgi:ribosomal protein L14E/L6E/L27E|nr:KOW domain-containing RNA-binding protein [Oscillospiraceae bacterium]